MVRDQFLDVCFWSLYICEMSGVNKSHQNSDTNRMKTLLEMLEIEVLAVVFIICFLLI